MKHDVSNSVNVYLCFVKQYKALFSYIKCMLMVLMSEGCGHTLSLFFFFIFLVLSVRGLSQSYWHIKATKQQKNNKKTWKSNKKNQYFTMMAKQSSMEMWAQNGLYPYSIAVQSPNFGIHSDTNYRLLCLTLFPPLFPV